MSNESPASVLYDASGNPIEIVTGIDGSKHAGVAAMQDIFTSTNNSSTANLASGASFTGTGDPTIGIAGLQTNIKTDQPVRVSVQQSTDNSNWDIQDDYDLPPGIGDGRTIQATASYVRVVVINIGPSTTTYFRLQSMLCPMVEAVPRTLTPQGHLSLSSQTDSFSPDPANFMRYGQIGRALVLDSSRNLQTRGPVLTDELSFREDFTQGSLQYDLTGTCYFRNGERHVVGIGTSFLSELIVGQYLKLSTDSDDVAGIVTDVHSNTDLILEEDYIGTTGNGTGARSDWLYLFGTGASATMASSEIILASGTTIYSACLAKRSGDYLPFTFNCKVKFSQRIANQAALVGFLDNQIGVNADARACVEFDGTDNTEVLLRTGSDSTSIEETAVTLPGGGTTNSYHDYQIQVGNDAVILWIDGYKMAVHTSHIPGPYQPMDVFIGMFNYGTPASSSDFIMDNLSFSNYDKLDVGISPQGGDLVVRTAMSPFSSCISVTAANSDTQLLAINRNRLGATVFNDSTAILYLKLGSGASTSSFTVRMGARDYYEIPYNYTGQINGYWASANGSARVTEVS